MLNSLSNVLPTGAEKVMLAGGGVLGGALSFAFGDVGPLLIWLAVFIVADLITGTIAAIRRCQWRSARLYTGVFKKLFMLLLVALAHGLDVTFEPLIGIQIFQSITICAYACGEFGSVIENLERGGFGSAVPPVLRRLVATLEERVEANADLRLSQKGMRTNDESRNQE